MNNRYWKMRGLGKQLIVPQEMELKVPWEDAIEIAK